ncbi:MAG: electron transfer flavoprotein subunit alpha/FixB family protein [Actinobacteria bacterium]|nr:MAG: electron transfer flavoprotein subunit alpha/FixB family protein [Actinomycetota bacterium]
MRSLPRSPQTSSPSGSSSTCGRRRPASRSRKGFAVLEELAELLRGAVGCSRAVTMAGWRPHTDQVGQTGTKIAPDIYIACGISGATQHMAGCKGAKKILAINVDPEASIMASADYAVIGDLHEVVPAVSAEIRKARGT